MIFRNLYIYRIAQKFVIIPLKCYDSRLETFCVRLVKFHYGRPHECLSNMNELQIIMVT